MAAATLDTMARRRHLRPASAAASTATRPTRRGSCRTSRRCSTTTRCSRVAYARGLPGDRATRTSPRVARETLDYVLREMTAPGRRLLLRHRRRLRGRGGAVLRLAARRAPQRARPETETAALRRATTASPPRATSRARTSSTSPLPDEAAWEALRAGPGQTLRRPQRARPAPLRDDKIIAAWNGLAISALAVAGRVLRRAPLRRGGGARRGLSRSSRCAATGGCAAPATTDGRGHRATSTTTPSWPRACSISSRRPSSRAGWPRRWARRRRSRRSSPTRPAAGSSPPATPEPLTGPREADPRRRRALGRLGRAAAERRAARRLHRRRSLAPGG